MAIRLEMGPTRNRSRLSAMLGGTISFALGACAFHEAWTLHRERRYAEP
jgi:hypothetical protein